MHRARIAASIVVVLIASTLVFVVAPPARAAAPDCTGAANTFTGNGGASGNYNDPAMWSLGTTPNNELACIPAGKTALIPNSMFFIGTNLRIVGTLKASGDNVLLGGGAANIENFGRFESPSGTKVVFNTSGLITNRPGGVVSVDGGTIGLNLTFDNAGGNVDLPNSGTFFMGGALSKFVQGLSADATPVQGTVTSGKVQITSGAALEPTGTGAGAFEWPPGSSSVLTGTLHANQTIDLHCDGFSGTVLRIVADATNEGTINFNPRTSGTSCTTDLDVPAAVTFTNSGSMTFGDPLGAASSFLFTGAGNIVNGPDGTLVVNQTLSGIGPKFSTDGQMTVNPTGSYNSGNNSQFELRDGTLTNNGVVGLFPANTFAIAGIFRVMLGNLVGHPIEARGYRIELVGPGNVAIEVEASTTNYLQNPSGPVLIRSNQSIVVNDGDLETVGPVENQGTVTMTGRGDAFPNFGTPGTDAVTNHGHIISTSLPNTGTDGVATFAAPIVNETDGVITVQPGRICDLRAFTNKGLIDLGNTCLAQAAASTLTSTSILRVHSSADSLTALLGVISGTTLAGTLDVVTDAGNPPSAGAPRDLVVGRSPNGSLFHTVDGSFDTLTGVVSPTLGYALSYIFVGGGRRAQLQVIPLVTDLIVGDMDAPATAAVGDDVTVNWTTTVGTTTSTPWTDSVFLSSSPNVDSSSVFLGRLNRTGTATAGVARPGSIQVRIPAATDGQRFIVVVADSGLALPTNNRAAATGAKAITVGATPLAVGSGPESITVGANGTRTAGATTATLEGTRLLRLDGDADKDIVVALSPANAVQAFEASGRLPSEDDHDAAAFAGTMLVPGGDGSTKRFVLLRNTSASPLTVSVSAAAPGLSIVSSSPSSVIAGSPAPTALAVVGTGFLADSEARLVCGATTIDALSTVVDDSRHLTSMFALPTAVGVCDVKVGSAVRSNALTVAAPAVLVEPSSLKVDIDIEAPGLLRSSVDNRITVRWKNNTGYSLPAPLFQVSVDNGFIRFPGTPGNGGQRVDVLGIASTGPAGVLAPGAGGSTELLVRGVPAHQEVNYFVAGVSPGVAEDFGSALVAGLSPDVPATARDWVATNGPTMFGLPRITTAAVFSAHLDDVASYLSSLGRRIPEVARLVNFDLSRVTADGRLDAFQSSEFGVGQSGMALPRITVEAGTNDVIIVAGALRERFGKQANGTYLSPPASGDLLTPNGGGWALVALDGTRRTFGSDGVLASVTDPDHRTTTFGYSGGRLTSITGPIGEVTTFAYDGAGRVTSESDPDGLVTTYTYDGSGRVASATEDGFTVSTTWGPDGLAATMTNPNGSVVDLTRDAFGRVTQRRINGVLDQTTAYNNDGSITLTDAAGQTSTYAVDDSGAPAKVIDSAGRITTVRRDAKGNQIGMLADGLPIGDVMISDSTGRITGSVDGAGHTTLSSFDNSGQLLSITDPDGRRTSIKRDAALRPTAVTDPAGAVTTYAYDGFGRPSKVTDRTGRNTTFTYDANELMTHEDVAGFGTITYTHDARRNLASASGPTGTTTLSYNAHNQLAGVSYPNGLSLTFGYDSAGRRTSTTTSDGQVTTAVWDNRNQLSSLSANGNVITRYEYDPTGRLKAIANANGTRTVITRDALGRVAEQKTTCCTPDGANPGATVVSDVQMSYDNQDRVLTRLDAAGTTTYAYDGAGYLVSAVTTGAIPRTITYTYDAAGNRLASTDTIAGDVTSTIGVAGRPTQIGGETVTHDAEGRQTGRGSRAYTYDAQGAFASATVGGTTTTYTYDALGTPISRTTGGTTTKLLMDPTGMLVGEYDAAGVRQAGYAWGFGLAARLDAGGAASSFYTTDPRGDTVALTDPSGAVTDTYRYLPFGEIAARTGTTAQPFAFQGLWGLTTEPSGLVDARARQYDPQIGRFLTEDPELLASGNPAAYVSNDPVNRTDISGAEDYTFIDYLTNPVPAAGFNTGPGSARGNIANGTGLLATGGTAVSNSLIGHFTGNAAQAEDAFNAGWAEFKGMAGHLGMPPPPPIRLPIDRVGERLWQAREATLNRVAQGIRNAEEAHFNATSNIKNLGRLSKGLGVLGAAANFAGGWEAYKKNPNGWNGVRQLSKAFLKTVAPPIVGLAFDTIEQGVDDASLLGLQAWCGVDPILLYNETGWNARYELRKKKNHSGSGDSSDPNAIIGPAGVVVGSDRFVSGLDQLPYTIQFENKPDATLPANEVVVTQTLDPDLDLSTFELGEISIGNASWVAPSGQHTWTTVLDDQAQSGLLIKLNAKLDLGTRVVTWDLVGIDPVTGDVPADATKGFLPPDATAPEGRGFVTYVVRALGASPTGTAVVGQATIVFDANAPINTNVDTVVIDAAAPTAAPSVPSSASNPVNVTIGAVDDNGGSGVDAVEVLASKDGAPFSIVGDQVTENTFAFSGVPGSHYEFRVEPADKVGNVGELSASSGDVLIAADGGQANPTLTLVAPSAANVGDSIHSTATLAGGNGPTGTITFSFFAPDNTTCSGQPFATGSVPVSDNGSYQSADVVPDTAGTYRWIATYSGDNANTQAPTFCDAGNSTTLVSAVAGPAVKLEMKTTPATRAAPGGIFAYTVKVTNTSSVPVTIATLTDSFYGDLSTRDSCVSAVGTVLDPSDVYTCLFAITFNGVEGDARATTATVGVHDENSTPATDTDSTSIALTAEVVAVSGGETGRGSTSGNPLPRTGSDIEGLVDIALVAIGFGSMLLLRRRRVARQVR